VTFARFDFSSFRALSTGLPLDRSQRSSCWAVSGPLDRRFRIFEIAFLSQLIARTFRTFDSWRLSFGPRPRFEAGIRGSGRVIRDDRFCRSEPGRRWPTTRPADGRSPWLSSKRSAGDREILSPGSSPVQSRRSVPVVRSVSGSGPVIRISYREMGYTQSRCCGRSRSDTARYRFSCRVSGFSAWGEFTYHAHQTPSRSDRGQRSRASCPEPR